MASQKTEETPETTQPEPVAASPEQPVPPDVGPGRTEAYDAVRPDGGKLRVVRNIDTGLQKTIEV